MGVFEKWYASQSYNRIMHLPNELFNTKGEGFSVTDFVDKITHISYNLALAGKPVNDDDLVSIIMNNIGLAFEATASSVQAQDMPISYYDLVALLLGAKLRMKSYSSPTLGTTPTTSYTATQSVSSSQGYNNRGRGTSFRGRGCTNSSSSYLPYLRRLRV